jgi:hypothetical protein
MTCFISLFTAVKKDFVSSSEPEYVIVTDFVTRRLLELELVEDDVDIEEESVVLDDDALEFAPSVILSVCGVKL